jgi:aspartate/methionine/tyrosine aminotransferase
MMQLFETVRRQRDAQVPPDVYEAARRTPDPDRIRDEFHPGVDGRLLDLYTRALDPDDPIELRNLWIGRAEAELGRHGRRPELAKQWLAAPVRRQVQADEILSSRATVRFVKELFNWFFRDDAYGELRGDMRMILSSGSVNEQMWGMPETLKDCVRFALDRDWYGYSDSRGRVPAREAVARYENARMDVAAYDASNVALTTGGTSAMSSLADFILPGVATNPSPALCGIPNYPPLVEALARRHATWLVPLPSRAGVVCVDALIDALTPTTPLVMLQTAANPTGAAVSEADLARLIRTAGPATMVLLDECHEWLGPTRVYDAVRATPNVVRISSLSKTWSVPGLKIGWLLADSAFIDAYYEYASTTFGGPPSFFYTLVEVLARMERWDLDDLPEPGPAELAEFEDSYGLDLPRLAAAYRSYRHDRAARERELTAMRDAAVVGLTEASASVIRPLYSINLAAQFPGWDDSYVCFRDILRRTGVSVFPGILTFCLSGGLVRVTTSQRWTELSAAMTQLRTTLAAGAER